MNSVLTIRKLAAWLSLAVILLGSGGAQLLHAIPGLGHHDHTCCHSHSHASQHTHSHSTCGHGHSHDHLTIPEAPETNFGEARWTVGHHCVLCEIIAVVHHGTLLVDQPETSAEFLNEQLFDCQTSQLSWCLVGAASPRGPPIS